MDDRRLSRLPLAKGGIPPMRIRDEDISDALFAASCPHSPPPAPSQTQRCGLCGPCGELHVRGSQPRLGALDLGKARADFRGSLRPQCPLCRKAARKSPRATPSPCKGRGTGWRRGVKLGCAAGRIPSANPADCDAPQLARLVAWRGQDRISRVRKRPGESNQLLIACLFERPLLKLKNEPGVVSHGTICLQPHLDAHVFRSMGRLGLRKLHRAEA